MNWFKDLVQGTPEIALFISIALGYAVGKVRVWKLSLGGIAGTLIVAIFVGMAGEVTLNDQVKNIAFALFIFTLGYLSGPSFFASLNRRSLRYGVFPVIEVVTILVITAVSIKILDLDTGTAAGLMGGGATESAVVGTATDAIGKLDLPADQIKTLQANVGTAYSISYICGLITIVLLTSQFAPAIMKIDLRAEAVRLWEKIGGKVEDPSQATALPNIVGRAQRVENVAGRTVAQVEQGIGDRTTIERISRDGSLVDVGPSVVLRQGDVVVLVGLREQLVRADAVIGPEVADSTLNLDLEIAQVLLANKELSGQTVGRLRSEAASSRDHGVFISGVSRMENNLPVQAGTEVHTGDVVRLTGMTKDVTEFAKKIGYKIDTGVKADFVFIALGVVVGMLIGKVTIDLGSVPLSLGTGGGCLLSGLLFGWIRAKHPTIGQYDPAAASVIKELGLVIFICCVGLSSGPEAVSLIEKYGFSLPLVGVLMTLVPACISLFVAWKVMKMPAPLTLGSVAGQQCSTPAITAVQGIAGNTTPLMSYTIVYALSNVVLPLMGPVVVAMAQALNG
ncbi:aspartate-alanine antiporter [Actinocorallia longicatena]|uniref:Aspartate-alanine antiporter n=1 Tax=Actinocorallia longicatena TaxID=111803 RepID=A0ABP6QMX8_9ACTN